MGPLELISQTFSQSLVSSVVTMERDSTFHRIARSHNDGSPLKKDACSRVAHRCKRWGRSGSGTDLMR